MCPCSQSTRDIPAAPSLLIHTATLPAPRSAQRALRAQRPHLPALRRLRVATQPGAWSEAAAGLHNQLGFILAMNMLTNKYIC